MISARCWPASAAELRSVQQELASARPPTWHPPSRSYLIGGCIVCFSRRASGQGTAGEPGWLARRSRSVRGSWTSSAIRGQAGHRYESGQLALREGMLREAAVGALPQLPDVLLVNATGRDHPLRAGLALHLGAVLDLPTVGVTHRPLLARGDWPPDHVGARSRLLIGGEQVGCWLRTRPHARPLAVHPAWRTDTDTACAVVLAAVGRVRAPEPLREARRVARRARASV